jgi:DNA-binding MarR family transcriptional regulator
MDDRYLEKVFDDLLAIMRTFHNVKQCGEAGGYKLLPMDPHDWTLFYLRRKKATMSELGERLHRSKPNMTAIVDKLVAEGKVQRLSDERDRRIIWVEITEIGKQSNSAKKEEIKKLFKQLLSKLDAQDLTTLSNALGEVNHILTKLGRSDL